MNTRRYVPPAEWLSVHNRPMRVAILKRRSKDDPDTKSLLVQHDAIVRWLNTLPPGSWTCDMRPADQGGDNYEQIVSAWKGKGQHRLLTQIMSRLSEYDVVVVHRIDRFGRNALTVLTALEEMKEAGVRLFSVEEGLDTANPTQQFNSGLLVLLAQQSSDLTSQRILGNKQRAKDLGGWRGGAITYGYRKAMTTGPEGEPVPRLDAHGYKTLEHDPDEVAHLLKAVQRIVDDGWSTAAVVRKLNADGVPSPRGYRTSSDGTREQIKWTTTGLRRILNNPALLGFDVVGAGAHRFQIHTVQGRPHRPHPPILDDARWQALQRALARPRSRRRAAKEPLLAGLVWCHASRVNGNACGRPMYGPGSVTTNNASYACRASSNLSKDDPERCSGNSVSAKNLHNLVELLVRGIASDERWPAAMEFAYASSPHAPASSSAVDVLGEIARLEASMADLRKERDAANSDRRRAMVDADINALDDQIAALEDTVPPRQGVVTTPVPLLSGWEGMSTPQRNNLLTTLIERIEILPFQTSPGQRGRTFDPSRVRMELRNVGTFHITRSVDTRAAAVSCPDCGKQYAEGSALGVHRRHKHGVRGVNSPKPTARTVYECPDDDCARTSTSAGGMKRHVAAVHGPHEAFPCPAGGCSRVLRSATDLTSHIRMSHGQSADRTLAPCAICGKVLRGEHGLRIHVGRIHPNKG